jgi:hypothetical protein
MRNFFPAGVLIFFIDAISQLGFLLNAEVIYGEVPPCANLV